MNPRQLIRDIAGSILKHTRVTHPQKRHVGRLVIATFHRVLPEEERKQYPYPGLAVTPDELYWILSYFKQHYTCGCLAETHQQHSAGEQPKKPFMAITFDDGQLDNYQHAFPVLTSLGMKASFFIPVQHIENARPIWHDKLGFAVLNATKTSGNQNSLRRLLKDRGISIQSDRWIGSIAEAAKQLAPEKRLEFVEEIELIGNQPGIPRWAALMTWSKIQSLNDAGHEIGSHSMTHALLPQCDNASLDFELAESKRILEQRLKQPIESFCYPNGDHDDRTIDAANRAGYKRAVTTHWDTNPPNANQFTLNRCDMDAFRLRSATGRLSEALLALRLSGLHPGL